MKKRPSGLLASSMVVSVPAGAEKTAATTTLRTKRQTAKNFILCIGGYVPSELQTGEWMPC